MKITVQFFGDLRKYLQEGEEVIDLEVEADRTVSDLLLQLGVEEGEVWVVSLNGNIVDEASSLKEGGKIMVFPPFGGG
jgi:sulfur carrier protein ThiS